MSISEIDANYHSIDIAIKRYLKELIAMDDEINEKLSSPEISVSEEMQLNDAKKVIEDNIQQIRVEGLWDQDDEGTDRYRELLPEFKMGEKGEEEKAEDENSGEKDSGSLQQRNNEEIKKESWKHKHDNFPEHPVRVIDHQKYFTTHNIRQPLGSKNQDPSKTTYKIPEFDDEIDQNFINSLPENIRTPEAAEKTFLGRLRRISEVNNGIILYHESPGNVKESVQTRGLIEESNFASIGEPSNFVNTKIKTIVKFRVPKQYINQLVPDSMTYGWSDKLSVEQIILLKHPTNNLLGTYVAMTRRVPPNWIENIEVKTSEIKKANNTNLVPKQIQETVHREGKTFPRTRTVYVNPYQDRYPEMRQKKRGENISPSGSRIPPNWQNVLVAKSKNSPLQAIGQDSKGRLQYLYSAEHSKKHTAAKFKRVKAFAQVLPRIEQRISKDVSKSEEALVLYIISKTGFRIGSNDETLAKVKAYGVSTLLGKHVQINGDSISFDFIGKKGVHIQKQIKDPKIAALLARKKKNEEKPLFKVNDYEVRKYLGGISGHKFSPKDFRTHLGTRIAHEVIQQLPPPTNEKEFKKFRFQIGDIVSKELGNTRSVALSSYISPEIFTSKFPQFASLVKSNTPFNQWLDSIQYDEEPEDWEEIEEDDSEENEEKSALELFQKSLHEKHTGFSNGFYHKFIRQNPKYDSNEFREYIIVNNRADRDAGELGDISKDEILRLAQEFDKENKPPIKSMPEFDDALNV